GTVADDRDVVAFQEGPGRHGLAQRKTQDPPRWQAGLAVRTSYPADAGDRPGSSVEILHAHDRRLRPRSRSSAAAPSRRFSTASFMLIGHAAGVSLRNSRSTSSWTRRCSTNARRTASLSSPPSRWKMPPAHSASTNLGILANAGPYWTTMGISNASGRSSARVHRLV